ncbi:hypothetical protein SAMN06298210_102184 [Prevotellaceae bacterium KH2P17]|nr:hypothetical protein SAMN06298210_102184 [Prevotellaceae bacterium KH2P17]
MIDGKTAMNTHKANLYPPLRKGRLGGDDCTRKLPTACRQIANCLPSGHPLLRLPFPRGGYQLALQHIVAHSFLTYKHPRSSKTILCYSVFTPQQQQKKYFVTLSLHRNNSRKNTLLLCLYTATTAEKLRCYAVFKNCQQPFLPLERGG